MAILWLQVQVSVTIAMVMLRAKLAAAAETEVTVTSPVNPVKRGGMLSLHCRVLNLDEETQTVAISREMADGGKFTRLTMGENLYTDDERIFLAVRRLSDSSKVYFMSIINVRRSDAGIYKCKLLSQNPIGELKIRSVAVTVMHLPNESPECTSTHVKSYTAGDTLRLNCTSEEGIPTVELAWYRSTNANNALRTETHNKRGIVISKLSKTLYESDNQAMFICKMSSDAFPGEQKTCHVGPITVLPNPLFTDKPPLENSAYDNTDENTNSIRNPNNGEGVGGNVGIPTAALPDNTHCREYCSALTAPVLYWIIATIAVGILAIIFLIIGIVISVKLCNASSSSSSTPSSRHGQLTAAGGVLHRGFPQSEDTYAELDSKPDDNRVYMMLDRSQIPEMQPLNPNLDREGNYTRTPTAIKEITLIPTQCV